MYDGRDKLVDGAVVAADVVLAGLAARSMANDRRNKVQAMTPAERAAFRSGTPLRVAKRAAWIALWIGLVWAVFAIWLSPGWLGTIALVGPPLVLFVGWVMKSRRFWRTRQAVWDAWFRTQGTSLGELREWYASPDTSPEQRQQLRYLLEHAA
jgi:hypothetical protein